MQAVNSSETTADSKTGENARTTFEPEKVRNATNRLASIYCQQVHAVCKHHAAMARIDQSRSALIAKQSQTQSRIERLLCELKEAEAMPRQIGQLKNQKAAMQAELASLRGALTLNKSAISPLLQQITRQQGEARRMEQTTRELESQLARLNQLLSLNPADIDCSSTMDRLRGFFTSVTNLGQSDISRLKGRLIAGCDSELSSRHGDELSALLASHLQGAAAAMLACESVGDFSCAFKGVQSRFIVELTRKLDNQQRIISRLGNVTHAAACLLATGMLVHLIAHAYYSGKNEQHTLLRHLLQGVLICGAYGLANMLINRSLNHQLNRWAAFSGRMLNNANRLCDKTGRQLESQSSSLTNMEGTLFRQWRVTSKSDTGLAVSDAIQKLLHHCAQNAPVEKLAELRTNMLKDLRLPSLDQAHSARSRLMEQIEESRLKHGSLEDQTRQLRLELTEHKDEVVKLEQELKHGLGKKLQDDMGSLDKKLRQKPAKTVDMAHLDELKAKVAPLQERLEMLEVEAQNLRQAYHAKLAELSNEVGRHQLPDSVIQAARLHVCNQLGWFENMFNVMWNRHVGLSPEQLKARVNGESSTGSLGLPVPGHTSSVGASSYATPELALKALFDVTDAMKDFETSSVITQTMVPHEVPVGLSAVAPEGHIKTIAATLVEVKPAMSGQPRRLHLTPVTLANSISLTPDAAEQVHQLSQSPVQ